MPGKNGESGEKAVIILRRVGLKCVAEHNGQTRARLSCRAASLKKLAFLSYWCRVGSGGMPEGSGAKEREGSGKNVVVIWARAVVSKRKRQIGSQLSSWLQPAQRLLRSPAGRTERGTWFGCAGAALDRQKPGRPRTCSASCLIKSDQRLSHGLELRQPSRGAHERGGACCLLVPRPVRCGTAGGQASRRPENPLRCGCTRHSLPIRPLCRSASRARISSTGMA